MSFRSVMMSEKVDKLLNYSFYSCLGGIVLSSTVITPAWLGVIVAFGFLVVMYYNQVVWSLTKGSER